MAAPVLLLVGHRLFRIDSADIIDYILEKSVSYQKKDGGACPSFFWYDNDKDVKVCFLVTRVI